jgi:kynurenine formamidase
MAKLIDLSWEIYQGMPVYPGDIEVELENDKKLESDDYENHNLKMGMHAGTHLDLPAHMIKSDYYVSEAKLDSLCGKAKLIYAAGEELISYKKEYDSLIEKDDRVLIYTGFAEKYGSRDYYEEHPVIGQELAHFLIDRKIKMLGFDMPSPDSFPYQIHKLLFKNNIFILENLTNLDKLLGYRSFELLVFPLKIRAEAAPVRAAALLE